MDNETVITWSVANWITVVLMVIVGFAVIGFAAKSLSKLRANSDA